MDNIYVEYYKKTDDAFAKFKHCCCNCTKFVPYFFDRTEHCSNNHRIKEILIETWPDTYDTYWVRKLGGCEDFVRKEKWEE